MAQMAMTVPESFIGVLAPDAGQCIWVSTATAGRLAALIPDGQAMAYEDIITRLLDVEKATRALRD